MAINNNSPTFTYVGWTGASVLYNNELYTVLKGHTQDRYIYWDYNTPNKFITSMKQLEKTTTRFLVAYNDKGIYTLVPNEDILVSFDESNDTIIKDRIYGIYEKNKEFEEKFVAVEVDIDGIKSIVGESEEDEGTLLYKMSKVQQQADRIELSVEEVTKEFNTTVETNKLREEVNNAFLKLNTDLGTFKSLTTKYFKDDKVDSTEKSSISASINLLVNSKNSLYSSIDKIIDLANKSNMTASVTNLNNGKSALNTAHNNLVNTINSVISDNIITPSDRTLVINCFAQYNLKIQELKGTCDEVVILGTGGKIIEEIAKIGIKSDEIELSVQQTEKDTNSKISDAKAAIKITTDSIQSQVTAHNTRIGNAESKITQQANQIATKVDVNGVKSTIQQNPESVRIAFSGINDSIDFDHSGLLIWHPNGRHTRISSEGIKFVNNSNGQTIGDYHYLTYVVGFTTTADTGSYKWIQLPNEFKGKNFNAYATLSDTWDESWDWGEPWVVQRMVAFVADYDRYNGRVAVQGYRTDKNYKTGEHRHCPIAGMLIVIA